MEFYEKRTVDEQANRLPNELRDAYRNSQIDRIEIDGEVITGYFEYSFLEEKSYKEQPVRSDDGTIQDLNSYSTFLTPRVIIRYNMMNIEDYRKLMKKLKSKNAFNVVCYDIVEDKRVQHEMYFATPQMPVIYQQYLMALGIKEYTIELIGTNRHAGFSITYDYNLPDYLKQKFKTRYPNEKEYMVYTDVPYNAPFLIGNIYLPDGELLESTFPSAIINSWNTSPNGDGITYKQDRYFIQKDLTLYAQWQQI